jgi:hypothetical protein
MLNIRVGAHSPRVTLLQILLNSHACTGVDGRRPTVHGAYGLYSGKRCNLAPALTEQTFEPRIRSGFCPLASQMSRRSAGTDRSAQKLRGVNRTQPMANDLETGFRLHAK